jgi:hypothetical protein
MNIPGEIIVFIKGFNQADASIITSPEEEAYFSNDRSGVTWSIRVQGGSSSCLPLRSVVITYGFQVGSFLLVLQMIFYSVTSSNAHSSCLGGLGPL